MGLFMVWGGGGCKKSVHYACKMLKLPPPRQISYLRPCIRYRTLLFIFVKGTLSIQVVFTGFSSMDETLITSYIVGWVSALNGILTNLTTKKTRLHMRVVVDGLLLDWFF